ncbi:hypothetical protein ABEB36_006479 [Hypothenemus hampei]|uniref:TsaA-like domain-containing protein n=1 Tax=Hypothenemus hampei TaxID=57062 RepID=A0ABD1ESX5_HYPHA
MIPVNKQIAKLEEELGCARNEIANLRKQLNQLKHLHKKEMATITKTLDNFQWKNRSNEETTPKNSQSSLNFKPIGVITSQFSRIKGTPRQPTITEETTVATVTLDKQIFTNPQHALQDLDQFSHMWIIFVFHEHKNPRWGKIAPPRLNGLRTGVFASRAPHRPCPIGLSLVRIKEIVENAIHFYGVDMVDGTPVLDIKPYIPHYDRIDEDVRIASWISDAPVHQVKVHFTEGAIQQLKEWDLNLVEQRLDMITKVLQEDPRSVFLRNKWSGTPYKLKIENLCLESCFNDHNHSVTVTKITKDQHENF